MNGEGLKPWQQLLVLLLVIAAIISRRPDAFLNPQFYAEDGAVWFADDWNLGLLHSLTLPAGGYLNTLPRLICGMAVLLPLKSAPLLLNWCGVLLQTLPASLLLTRRCTNWGPLWIRALQATLYVALPNSSEIHVTITNAHFHLAVAACLLAFAAAPSYWAWMLFDILILLLTGLTGPWSLVLTPLVLAFWWFRRQPWSLKQAALLLLCTAAQTWELLHHINVRPSTPLGASFRMFARVVSGQIYAAALWGHSLFGLNARTIPLALVFAAGTFTILYGLIALRLEMRLFIVFAMLVTAAALANPLVAGQPRWQVLASGGGSRYWIFAMLALVWTILWMAADHRRRAIQIFGVACLLTMQRGIRHDWRYPPFRDESFGTYVRSFDLAKPGTLVTIPIFPDGVGMTLVKK